MATSSPASGQAVNIAPGSQLAAISQLLPQLFGTKSTTTGNPGDTAALQQLLAQLQGADYSKMLQAVFQQAAGQIPGFQAAFGNAVGARSGNNSAVEAALSRLLEQTTLAGSKQVADATLQNQQIQAQAGNAIANATKNTQQTQKQAGSGGQLAGLLAGIQAIKAITGARDIEDLGKKLGIGNSGRAAGGGAVAPVSGPVAPVASAPQQNITGATAPAMSQATPGFDPTAFLTGGSVPTMPAFDNGGNAIDPQVWADLGIDPSIWGDGGFSQAPDMGNVNWNELGGGGGMSTNPGVTGGFNWQDYAGPAPEEFIDFGEYF